MRITACRGWRAAFQFGHAGVDLFFVISGFVILFVHWEDIGRPQRISRYAGRRLTRILPIYWVALALTIASRAASLHIIHMPTSPGRSCRCRSLRIRCSASPGRCNTNWSFTSSSA